MALEPAKLSDFQMAGSLGQGATARVYDATHIATGRAVAIKVMESSDSTGLDSPGGPPGRSEMRERFAREALLLSNVQSRHVGKILGFGFDRGQPFLVLERLHGETLDGKLRRDGPIAPPVAMRWIEQLLVGIRDCHDANVIHRDIKPSNIYLHHEGFDEAVKLIDFGVARLREIKGDAGGLTSTNHLIGSMGYMAPEQFHNAKGVGFPADLYAVGVVVFRTLTGRLPFVSRSLEMVIRMKSEQRVPQISSLVVGMAPNPLLDWFVQKAMSREPSARFQSAREMLEHWWNVMASLDEDGATDIIRGMGRVDESYAGVRPSAPRSQTDPPPTVPRVVEETEIRAYANANLAGTQRLGETEEHPADHEDRTLRRAPVALPSGKSAVSAIHRPSSPPSTEPEDFDEGEITDPFGYFPGLPDPVEDEGDDAFDMPTRADPNLRKLVEAELAVQKARKRGG